MSAVTTLYPEKAVGNAVRGREEFPPDLSFLSFFPAIIFY
jgi:hypothetical protein